MFYGFIVFLLAIIEFWCRYKSLKHFWCKIKIFKMCWDCLLLILLFPVIYKSTYEHYVKSSSSKVFLSPQNWTNRMHTIVEKIAFLATIKVSFWKEFSTKVESFPIYTCFYVKIFWTLRLPKGSLVIALVCVSVRPTFRPSFRL